ncbi:MAG: hypothetical protein J3K34DRAFT_423968 [Monoraphidium minutum]|nr:MAG: hypothetical protein J3K34DRAFT_423968 [Monoraphidium minutum]
MRGRPHVAALVLHSASARVAILPVLPDNCTCCTTHCIWCVRTASTAEHYLDHPCCVFNFSLALCSQTTCPACSPVVGLAAAL